MKKTVWSLDVQLQGIAQFWLRQEGACGPLSKTLDMTPLRELLFCELSLIAQEINVNSRSIVYDFS